MGRSTPKTLSMTGPIEAPPIRTSSLKFMERPRSSIFPRNSCLSADLEGDLKKRMSWTSRSSTETPDLGLTARDMRIKRFDGAARSSRDWDGLRRDPELWFSDGNCLVYLYGRGQSKRGPAFRVSMETLVACSCLPLLDRFMVDNHAEPLISKGNSSDESSYFSHHFSTRFELYIPAPPSAEREQSFIYHAATRNFFAWVFGRPLVGSHLGGALVGLLNSMNEFRSADEDNILAIMDYMDEEGYADLRNSSDHALGVLFFAEHFFFKDMWTDAFAHCVGMHEKLYESQGFRYTSRASRALITRSRLEMDMRLEYAGQKLGSFLSDDLSDAHLGLSIPARNHLDKFRSFLFQYHVSKFGYFPPSPSDGTSTTFPKNIYGQMCQEFKKLYDFLVDSEYTSSDSSPTSQYGGICVLQSVQAFDSRHKYQSLLNPLPRLPEGEDAPQARPPINSRLSWLPSRSDKMKPDPRLVTYASLTKATNCADQSLLECSLVRAYRGFERDCIFTPTKGDKSEKLSHADARKVRWILIYGVLQTLLSTTKIPMEVRDTQNVSYNLCVLTAGCPPWKSTPPYHTLLQTQTNQIMEKGHASSESLPYTPSDIKPDIDYFAINHRPQKQLAQTSRPVNMYTLSNGGSSGKNVLKKGTVRRAISTLGNMPELSHPTPKRPIFHEILVHGYGNGTNTVNITTGPSSPVAKEVAHEENHHRHGKQFSVSSDFSAGLSSRWSKSSFEDAGQESSASSLSSRRDSDSLDSIQNFLDRPMSTSDMVRVAGSDYPESIYSDSLEIDPLQVKKDPTTEGFMKVTTEVKVEYQNMIHEGANDELLAYLNAK